MWPSEHVAFKNSGSWKGWGKKNPAIYPMNLNANKFTSTELKRKIQVKGNEIVAWDAYRHEERV